MCFGSTSWFSISLVNVQQIAGTPRWIFSYGWEYPSIVHFLPVSLSNHWLLNSCVMFCSYCLAFAYFSNKWPCPLITNPARLLFSVFELLYRMNYDVITTTVICMPWVDTIFMLWLLFILPLYVFLID